jgi:hypothetical protein
VNIDNSSNNSNSKNEDTNIDSLERNEGRHLSSGKYVMQMVVRVTFRSQLPDLDLKERTVLASCVEAVTSPCLETE